MLPSTGEEGDLERLCVAAAHSANAQVAGYVEAFAAQLGADQWPAQRAGKLHLRASLSARDKDPFITLKHAFQNEQNLIPLAHASFNPIVDLLRSLA